MIRRFLREFMVGRYGFDQLSFALTVFGLVMSTVVSILRIFLAGLIYRSGGAYIILQLLSFLSSAPYLIALFRAVSRNIDKRRSENAAFLRLAGRWTPYIAKKIRQLRDKDHRYFNCPGCKRTLRVPKGRGRINIDCPHCGRQFTKRT